MQVNHLMNPEVETCDACDDLAAVVRKMHERKCGCLVVLEKDRIVGIVTDRDVCVAAWARDALLREIPVGEVMTRDVVTCSPDDDSDAVEQRMRDRRIRRIPVVDLEQRLVGIVTTTDLAAAIHKSISLGDPVHPLHVADTVAAVSRGQRRGYHLP